MGELETRTEQMDGIVIITILSQRVAAETSDAFDEQIVRLVQQVEGPPKVLLDFSSVRFITSATLGKLIKLNGRVVTDRGGQLKLCSLDERILEVFRVTGLNQLFRIFPGRKEALASFV